MATPGDVIGKVRDHYLKHFKEVLREKRRLPQAHLTLEPIVKMGSRTGMTPLREGALGLPRRQDLVISSGQDPQLINIVMRRGVDFEPIDFEWTETTTVHVEPFRWEECRVRIPGMLAEDQWAPLLDWFDKWFDEFENKVALSRDFNEVIHSIGDPLLDTDSTVVVVDLGSSTLEAFEEMLDAFTLLGATSIDVGDVAAQPE
ncbi:MAG: hypothetical protein AB7K24_17100 [Gemmataceae bacterium]